MNSLRFEPIDASKLTKNQKKKLRQKKSRFYKQNQPTEPAIDHPHSQIHRDARPEKRPKLQTAPPSSPKAVASAEPVQKLAQVSNSVDAPAPAAFPTPIFPLFPVDEEDMSNPVYRQDFTHIMNAQVLISDNGDQEPLPVEDAGSLSDHMSTQQQQHDGLVTMTAASAPSSFFPPPPVTNTTITTTSLTTTTTAAPLLSDVAPIGPNGMRVYIHGNYHRYYGYRIGQAFDEDPRVALFERHWFAKKRCMDVGCNEGIVTLGIAMKYGTRSMVGVDLDEHLIRRACTYVFFVCVFFFFPSYTDTPFSRTYHTSTDTCENNDPMQYCVPLPLVRAACPPPTEDLHAQPWLPSPRRGLCTPIS